MLQGRELQVKYHPEYLPALWPRMMHETLSICIKSGMVYVDSFQSCSVEGRFLCVNLNWLVFCIYWRNSLLRV